MSFARDTLRDLTGADTIVAIATARGRAGVGIIRLSGPESLRIAHRLTGRRLKSRYAEFCNLSFNGEPLDQAVVIYFQSPASFTGEEVVEFQCHGGPVVLDMIVDRILSCGARQARPGEFSERAFLNDKIDLVQAEAIADLINASSEEAVKSAVRSLEGHFSAAVDQIIRRLIDLRTYVEAALDFPDEEIEFLDEGRILEKLKELVEEIRLIRAQANRGATLRDGLDIVLVGEPNVGKSSLLNALLGYERAIVTEHEGTTRDTLKESILIGGVPIHLIDTAGIRESADPVEQSGIQRTWDALSKSDHALLLVDSTRGHSSSIEEEWPELASHLEVSQGYTVVRTKIDLSGEPPGIKKSGGDQIGISVMTGEGLEVLVSVIQEKLGLKNTNESVFLARRRHLQALDQAGARIDDALNQFLVQPSGDLLGEDLRLAQKALEEISGAFTADDLLGKIFSSFCVGK